MSFKIRDLIEVIKKSGITKMHIIHSTQQTGMIRIHVPINCDYKALEENLRYDVPVGLAFDIRFSAHSYFKVQMIKRWGKTTKITTCHTFAAWDEECEKYGS